METHKNQLIKLIKDRMVHREGVKLSGGGTTDIYLNIKGVLCDGQSMRIAAHALREHLREHKLWVLALTAIGGPTMGGDILSHSLVLTDPINLKWFSIRNSIKSHGLGQWIEGATLGPEDKVILVDDVASSGASLVESYERVIETGAEVLAIVPLVDRSDRTAERFANLTETPYLPVLTYQDLDIPAL